MRWADVVAAAPDLARDAQARFEATGLAVLATLKRDGSPRLGGIEPGFHEGDLWLGMMEGSRKALDLRRDPRVALHAANEDKDVKQGDAWVAGRAEEVVDEAEKRRLGAAFAGDGGQDPDAMGPWHLFRVDVTEVHHLAPAGDHLVIRWWTPDGGLRSVDRY